MSLQFSGGKGLICPFNLVAATGNMGDHTPKLVNQQSTRAPAGWKEVVPVWCEQNSTLGLGGARVQLCYCIETQPRHHLPNTTTFGGSVYR